MLGPIVERQTIDVVYKCLSRSVLGKDEGMVIKFNLIISIFHWNLGLTHDRYSVDERTRLNEYVVDQQGMIG